VDTVKVLRQRLNSRQLDILCINEGIACPIETSAGQAEDKDFLDTMLVDALAPARMAKLLGDLVPPAFSSSIRRAGRPTTC